MATATLLTPTTLQQHVETDLTDAALQRILDSEETEIIRRYGAHATETEILVSDAENEWLLLGRAPASITSITETVGDDDTALSSDDYRNWGDGRLERLPDGTNPRSSWGDRTTVVYVPVDRNDQRTLVLVQLCKLALEYNALKSERIGSGDYQSESLDYVAERERLLRTLAPRGIRFA